MTTDITTAAEFHLTEWWDKNKAWLGKAVVAVAAVALVVSYIVYSRNQKEIAASEALSAVAPAPGAAQAFLKVAGEYAGTAAASRAVLLAAGAAYADGKYSEAQGLFERYLRESQESPQRPIALLGVAASLDAQGKKAEAITKYQEISSRYAADPAGVSAKSALARIYVQQNQFAQALALYQELARTESGNSFGLESMIQMQDLLAKHPELAQAKGQTTVKKP